MAQPRRILLLASPVIALVLGWVAGLGLDLVPRAALALLAALIVGVSLVAIRAANRAAVAAGKAAAAASKAASRANPDGQLGRFVERRTRELVRDAVVELRKAGGDSTAQTEAFVQLLALLQPTAALPRLRGWAASPDALLALSTLVREERPSLVVDLGSGSSTLVTALTMKRFGIPGRVVGVDHDAEYAELTRALLARHDVQDIAEVRTAPLREQEIGGATQTWYDASVLADLHDVGLVFVDGPPGTGSAQARRPALAALRDRLAPAAVLLLDDADRPDETAIAAAWAEELGAEVRRLPLEKGGALIRLP